MKIWIPINPLWYIAMVIIFGPFTIINFTEHDWVARLVSISILYIFSISLALYWGIDGKVIKFRDDAIFIKRFGKDKIIFIFRIILIVFGVIGIYSLLLPLIKDIILIKQEKAPLTRIGFVALTSRRSLTGFMSEQVVLDNKYITKENSFTAYYFNPRFIQKGNTYEFLYLPNTHYILEAKLIKTED